MTYALTGGFRAAGRRIWTTFVVTYLVSATKRFIAEEPANELEAQVFTFIRDVVAIVKRRFKTGGPDAVGPDC